MVTSTSATEVSAVETAPSLDEPPSRPHAAVIRELSDRLLALQRPLRVLEALRWPDAVEAAFLRSAGRELPRVTRDTYCARPLPFDAPTMHAELIALRGAIERRLGDHPAGALMATRCRHLHDVIDLLAARGTAHFAALSRRVYGSSREGLPGGSLEACIDQAFAGLVPEDEGSGERELDAWEAARWLGSRLRRYFHDGPPVRIVVTAALTADASVCHGYLKLRERATFRLRDLRLLEAHEGWAHLGTTFNGLLQPTCTFLSRSVPATTTTQEGLAVLTEMLAGVAHAARRQRLAARARAIALAEAGADFLDVVRFFTAQGEPLPVAYQQASRLFRGSLPSAGPFTKDLAYTRGLALVRAHLADAPPSDLGLLFCGKTSLDDLPALAALADEGLLVPARRTPPPFARPRAPAELLPRRA